MLLEMQLLGMIASDLNMEADLWSLLEYLLLFFFFLFFPKALQCLGSPVTSDEPGLKKQA